MGRGIVSGRVALLLRSTEIPPHRPNDLLPLPPRDRFRFHVDLPATWQRHVSLGAPAHLASMSEFRPGTLKGRGATVREARRDTFQGEFSDIGILDKGLGGRGAARGTISREVAARREGLIPGETSRRGARDNSQAGGRGAARGSISREGGRGAARGTVWRESFPISEFRPRDYFEGGTVSRDYFRYRNLDKGLGGRGAARGTISRREVAARREGLFRGREVAARREGLFPGGGSRRVARD